MRIQRPDSGERQSNTFRILAWPARNTGNSIIRGMYDAMDRLGQSIEITDFDVRRNWVERPDVVHVHWPERATEPHGTLRAVVKAGLTLAHVLMWRLRGVPVVWTVHNLQSHEERHPVLESVVKGRFVKACRGSIHLSELGRHQADMLYPSLGQWPWAVIPLPVAGLQGVHDVRVVDAEITKLVSFGRIRAYKNTPQLVRAFVELGPDHPSHLLVVGKPDDPTIAAELEEFRSDPRITLDLRWIKDEEVASIVQDAHVAILPYRSFLNSGVIVESLDAGVPVAITRSPATEELQATHGAGWVRLVPSALSAADLMDVVRWAARPRPGRPDLSAHHFDVVAERTLDLLRRAADG